MFDPPERQKPGLLVVGTDTEVGKTVVSCAIAAAVRAQRPGIRLGALKPLATGCRDGEAGLVNDDALALAHFAGGEIPLDVVNPIRFRTPVAPAVASELEQTPVAWSALTQSLARLDEACDALLVEGVGGLMVPLDPREPRYMVDRLARALGYPVVVVCRAGLGTLNHTAMTVELLRQAGCRVAGLVVNAADLSSEAGADPAARTNRVWLERITGLEVLLSLPRGRGVAVERGGLDPAVVDAARGVDWWGVMGMPLEEQGE